jgi:hypothetical protein
MKTIYFVSYIKKNGHNVDEFYDSFSQANERKEVLVKEFGYRPTEIKVSCRFILL